MTAQQILQSYLDAICEAVLQGRFEDYAPRVALPFRLQTANASILLTDQDELEEGFDHFCDSLSDHGVTDLRFLVANAASTGADTLFGQYQTQLLAGTDDALPAFCSNIWLQKVNETWQATMIRNSTVASRWPISVACLNFHTPLGDAV